MRKAIQLAGVATLVAAPALAGALLLASAAPASAHSTLVESTPADGATVTAPLTTVELVFNEPVQSDFAQVVVIGDDGTEYQAGEPEIIGSTVTQTVDPPPDGAYSLSYRIVSADGHPVDGTLTFTMAAGSTATAPAEPTDEPTDESVSASPTESASERPAGHGHDDSAAEGSTNGAWILGAVVGAAVVAVLAFVAAGGRRRRAPGDTENQ